MRRIGFLECNTLGSGLRALCIAKELGLYVTFLTRDLNYYQGMPGAESFLRTFVDEVVECETNDPASIIAALDSKSGWQPLDGLMTFADYYVGIAAEVAQQLSLSSLNPAAARIGRNKLWAREACQRAGVPCPRFASAGTSEEAVDAIKQIGLPCVVKPADSSASIDVCLCRTLQDVEGHFQRIRARPINTRGQHQFPRVLIEELLLGFEVSVETITWHGHTTVIGVTDKNLSGPSHFIEMGHTFPSSLPETVVATCGRVALQALEAIGFDFGPAHVEIKVTREGPMLVEINPRLAGDRIADLIEYSLGIPLIQEVIRMHLGEPLDLQCSKPTPMGAAIRFLSASPGIVRRINGQDLTTRLPGIVEVEVKAQLGSVVRPLRNNTDRLGYVVAVAETPYVAGRLAESALLQIEMNTEQECPLSEFP